MRVTLLHAAGALVLATNVLIGINAARNRQGPAGAEVVLSECELRIDARDADNSFTLARFDLTHGTDQWLNQDKLRQMGFRGAGREAPRDAWVAVALRQSAVGATSSRLEAMDADVDPVALRQRHPDRQRVLVLAATIYAHNGRGWFGELARPVVVVPTHLASRLDAASCSGPGTGRLAITVRTGSRGEPWIADVVAR